RAGFGLQRTAVLVEGLQSFLGLAFAVWLLFSYLSRTTDAGGVLLLVYWALNLPVLADEIALLARQYPALRSVTLRLLEPLGAPEEPAFSPGISPAAATPREEDESEGEKKITAASIALSAVNVRAAG